MAGTRPLMVAGPIDRASRPASRSGSTGAAANAVQGMRKSAANLNSRCMGVLPGKRGEERGGTTSATLHSAAPSGPSTGGGDRNGDRSQRKRPPGSLRAAVEEESGAALDGDRRAVELGEREAVELLVVAGPLVAQDADGDLFAEPHRLQRVRAPVHAGDVAAGGD